jgi:hypothetical protein
MGMLQNQAVPNFPLAPPQYDASYVSQMNNILRLFFNQINAVQRLNVSGLNIDIKTLPTDADVANLRAGDVYRDTVDNSLKIKV